MCFGSRLEKDSRGALNAGSMVRKDRWARDQRDRRNAEHEGKLCRFVFAYLGRSKRVHEPNHGAVRLESGGRVLAGFRVRFAAKGGEDFALVFTSHEEIRVQPSIQDDWRKRDAPGGRGGNFNGGDPSLLLIKGRRAGKKRGGMAFDAQALEL